MPLFYKTVVIAVDWAVVNTWQYRLIGFCTAAAGPALLPRES